MTLRMILTGGFSSALRGIVGQPPGESTHAGQKPLVENDKAKATRNSALAEWASKYGSHDNSVISNAEDAKKLKELETKVYRLNQNTEPIIEDETVTFNLRFQNAHSEGSYKRVVKDYENYLSNQDENKLFGGNKDSYMEKIMAHGTVEEKIQVRMHELGFGAYVGNFKDENGLPTGVDGNIGPVCRRAELVIYEANKNIIEEYCKTCPEEIKAYQKYAKDFCKSEEQAKIEFFLLTYEGNPQGDKKATTPDPMVAVA